MYRHPLVNEMTDNAKKVIGGLFDYYMNNPQALPDRSLELSQISNKKDLAILISDYIAGMTDRFAIKEFEEKI